MKRYTVFFLLIGSLIPCFADVGFGSPLNIPIRLSGNFGEIRANHFHGGLDMKTDGAVRKPVYAIGNGYISRIRVSNGSGGMLYVRYDNGYTTINRHLEAFTPQITRKVDSLRYALQSWEMDITPLPYEYPVTKGQQIALSGNTGYSFGPHLHLDVYETLTGDFVDPMPMFAHLITDNTPPKAQRIAFFPQTNKGVVNGKTGVKTIPVSGNPVVEAWGEIGVGIKAYDYMDYTHNKYGVYSVTLIVDEVVVFVSTVDRFKESENRMINSWVWNGYMKSFIDPGNRLRMLKAMNGNRGLLTINAQRDYKCRYILADAFGNTSTYRFTIRGKKSDIPVTHGPEDTRLDWNRTNLLQAPGLEVVLPKGMLYNDAYPLCHVAARSGAVAYTYTIAQGKIPLHGVCELSIALRNTPVEDTSKYYIVSLTDDGRKAPLGGTYHNGKITAKVKELGTFTVLVDTVSPAISPVGKLGAGGKIVFRLKDEQSGIASCNATIDGRFALFGQPNLTASLWECRLDPQRVAKGEKHVLEFTATDACGNSSLYKHEFIW